MTYSIIARDPETGALGVAVQSHYFSVGPVVPWAQPGVGAVATQSMAEVSYGPKGLELMAAGASAPEALAELLEADAGRENRQVAMVDAHGRVAAHTGARCIVHAGDVQGDGVSAQANIMVSPEIWGAMLESYATARAQGAPMAARLLGALDAAESLGGDARGRQSAAILVVPGEGEAWDRELELRVEDHPEPLAEMRRLVTLHDAYALVGRAEDDLAGHRSEAALARLERALDELPDSHELRFWIGIGLIRTGDLDRGVALIREAIAAQPGWAWLLPRLSDETVPGASAASAALGLTT